MTDLSFEETEEQLPLGERELLEEIVLALVGRPEKASVEEFTEDGHTHFTIFVANEDIGKVIGKNGDTVSILRKLMGRITAARGKRVSIDVHDPSKNGQARKPRNVVAA